MTLATSPTSTSSPPTRARWLASVAEPRAGTSSGASAPTRSPSSRTGRAEEERAETDRIRAYEQAKFDAGWGALTWPEEYGGRDLPTSYALALPAGGGRLRRPAPHRDVLGDPAARRARPSRSGAPTSSGERYVRADAAHRPDRLPAVLRDRGRLRPRRGPHPGRPRGTTTGCSTATRCGPPGRRSPTSASRSRRTDPTAAKHAGLTVFLVPMDAPGVTVRPIRQMTGGSSLQRGLPRRRRALRRPPAGPGRPGLEGRADRAGRRTPRLRQPRPGQRRPRRRAGPAPRPPADRARAGPGRRPGDPQLRPAAHRHARRRRGRRRARPRTRGLGGQAARHRHHGPDLRGRPAAARPASSRPTPAAGAPGRGPSTCSARPATASPAAPTRSSTTSSPSACSACRGSQPAHERRQP